jgi:hypothetical protein
MLLDCMSHQFYYHLFQLMDQVLWPNELSSTGSLEAEMEKVVFLSGRLAMEAGTQTTATATDIPIPSLPSQSGTKIINSPPEINQ